MGRELISTLILIIGASLMIVVRRYKNADKSAGSAISGVTLFIILLIWLF
jgi:hypothetical protein